MNKVILMGRLTRDPEFSTFSTANGESSSARYTLAVDRRRRGGDGQQQADFIRCVTFGKNAEFAQKYLHKGTKILVSGRIQTGSYQGKDGNTVYTTDVFVEDHEFTESRQNNGRQQGYQPQGYQQAPVQQGYQQTPPAQQAGYQQGYQQPYQQAQQTPDGFMDIPDGIEEELPFQ